VEVHVDATEGSIHAETIVKRQRVLPRSCDDGQTQTSDGSSKAGPDMRRCRINLVILNKE
jgi:hypothetical protein